MTQDSKYRTPVTMQNTIWEWLIAIVINYIIFQAFWSYNVIYRQSEYNIDSANTATACASLLIFALVLTLGPLYRIGLCKKWGIRLRRPIALIAIIPAYIHSFLVIRGFIANEINLEGELKISAILGMAACGLTILLIATSYPYALRNLKTTLWRIFQFTGSFLLVLVSIAHYMVLGYYESWQMWFEDKIPAAPPAALIVTIFCALVILLRIADGLRWIVQQIIVKNKKSSKIITEPEMAE